MTFIRLTFRRRVWNTNVVAACLRGADRRGEQQQVAVLTLVAAVFKLGVIIVLICNDNGDLADPDERFVSLIRGRDRQHEFPLTLSVKAYRCGDVTWRGHITMATVTNTGQAVKMLSYS